MSIPVEATPLSDRESAMEFPSDGAVVLRAMPTMALQDPADIAKAMRQFDEEVFLSELMGEAIQAWFYSFRVAGKPVEGVSAQGAHEFARLRASQGYAIRFPVDQIRVEEVMEAGERGIRATVVARDARTGQEGIGLAFYPHYSERKNGDKEFDRMAGRKALSVAERNAILRLIPEATILGVLRDREKVIAANEARNRLVEQQVLANRPEAKAIPAERHLAETASRDAYGDEQGVSLHRRATSEHADFMMPFGPRKGSMLRDLTERDIRGALQWATEKQKYEEFRAAATAYLADLQTS